MVHKSSIPFACSVLRVRLIGRTEVPYVHYAGTYQGTGKPYFFPGCSPPPTPGFFCGCPLSNCMAVCHSRVVCESTFIPLKKTAGKDTTQLPISPLSFFFKTPSLGEGGGRSDPSTPYYSRSPTSRCLCRQHVFILICFVLFSIKIGSNFSQVL